MLFNKHLQKILNFISDKINPNLRKYLTSTINENQAQTKLALATISTISIVIGLFIIWASLTNIEEIARSPGVIMPVGQNYTIQHAEGGTVSNILVENGDKVNKGQKLIILNPTVAGADLRRLKNEALALKLDLIRLKAFIDNEELTKQDIYVNLQGFPVDPKEIKNFNGFLKSSISLLNQQNLAKKNEFQLLNQKIATLEDEDKQLTNQIENAKESLEVLGKAKAMYEKLGKSKTVSQITILNAIERFNDAEGELLDLEAKKNGVMNKLNSVKQQIVTIDARYKEKSLKEITEKNADLLEVKDHIAKLKIKLKDLNIKANASGIINGLNIDIGSVITPGATVLEIVPLDKDLVVEAKISTLDIGHVRAGDNVNVKVAAYNYVNYGDIKGEVVSISASTFLNENNQPYYKAIIGLEKDYLGKNPKFNKIIPGMTVTADIKTGEKSLVSYLLKPIHRTFNSSFSER